MRSLLLALLSLPCLHQASAAAVSYRVDFTGPTFSGVLPSGSFTYDPDAGFSNFFVNWNGAIFDLTPSANAPTLATGPATGCDSSASNHAYGFLIVSQAATGCIGTPQYGWGGYLMGGSGGQLNMMLTADAPQDVIGAISTAVPISAGLDMGLGGTWSVSAVPEPATWTMGLIAALSFAGLRLRGFANRQ